MNLPNRPASLWRPRSQRARKVTLVEIQVTQGVGDLRPMARATGSRRPLGAGSYVATFAGRRCCRSWLTRRAGTIADQVSESFRRRVGVAKNETGWPLLRIRPRQQWNLRLLAPFE